jgi:hypothetical protein
MTIPRDIIPWQLANDPDVYGDNAGKFILTTSNGEDEIGCVVYEHDTQAMQAAIYIESIARSHFRLETLLTRHSDRLDFHDVSVRTLCDAIAAAYEAGWKARRQT